MRSCLVDAGPLIALFDRDDKYHVPIVDFLKQFEGRLITSWPVLTEVMYMLDFNVQVQLDCLSWIEQDAVRLYPLKNNDIPRIIEITNKYSDVPMDLADATLMIISEKENIKEIITIDSDFYIYRDIRNEWLVNIFKV